MAGENLSSSWNIWRPWLHEAGADMIENFFSCPQVTSHAMEVAMSGKAPELVNIVGQ